MSLPRPPGLPAAPEVAPWCSPGEQVLRLRETAKVVLAALLLGVGIATGNHVSSVPRSPRALLSVPVMCSTRDRNWTQIASAPKEGDLVRDPAGEWACVNEVRRDGTAALKVLATPVSLAKAEELREDVCANFFAALRAIVALAGVSCNIRETVLGVLGASKLPAIWGLAVAKKTYNGICNIADGTGIDFKVLAGAVSAIATFGFSSSKEMAVRKPEPTSKEENLKAALVQMRILKPDELGPWMLALSQLLLKNLLWPFENFTPKLTTADPSVVVDVLIQVLETAQAQGGDYNPLERLTRKIMSPMLFNSKLGTAPWTQAFRLLTLLEDMHSRAAMPAATAGDGILFPPVHWYLFAGVGAVPAHTIIEGVKKAYELGFAFMLMPDKHAAIVAQLIGMHWHDPGMMELLELLQKQQGFVVKLLRKAAGLPALPGGPAPLWLAACALGQLLTPSAMKPALLSDWLRKEYARVCASPFL